MKNEKVRFYDPHPGFAGAMLPLPSSMLKLANELDGMTMELSDGLEKIKSVAEIYGGRVKRVEWAQSVHFEYNSGGYTHGYRLISYEYTDGSGPKEEPPDFISVIDPLGRWRK